MNTEQRAPSEGECVLAEAILEDDFAVAAIAESVMSVIPRWTDLNAEGEWGRLREVIGVATIAVVAMDPDGGEIRGAIPEGGWRPGVVATLVADNVVRVVRDSWEDECIHHRVEKAKGHLIDARMNLERLLEDEGLNGVDSFHKAMRGVAEAAEELGLSVEELNRAAKDAAEEAGA